ncbi:putative oxidoreductase [Frankia alni ACN14a]|uniref:Oxidoreductase n=1 Tax=Frankia alni (strain DSM 45986 / CECT 9034 / ACN14a) TaxID=326424 RepID=Q0RIR8_FRAAA|nr:putative oxidoreductase [Frankia alni ACN14a]
MGPRIGLAVARRFGREGFHPALIARDADRLTGHVAELAERGVTASAHPADAANPAALAGALAGVERVHGPVDVLVYNAVGAGRGVTAVLDVTVDSARDALDVSVLGAVSAVRAVLPGMLDRGAGTLLFTSGISAIHPFPFLGNVGLAAAGLRNYVLALAEALERSGVQVGHVPIGAPVAPGSPAAPEAVADAHWRLHADRDRHEIALGDVDTVRAAIARLTGASASAD